MRSQANHRRLKRAIKAGRVRSLEQVFKYIDARHLFKAAGLNPYGPAIKRIHDPGLFKVAEVYQLAEVIDVPGLKLLETWVVCHFVVSPLMGILVEMWIRRGFGKIVYF